MFRTPLHRDLLVVGWAVVMGLSAVGSMSVHTTWSGTLEAERVAGFLADVLTAFLWSFLLLLLAAWLRSKGSGGRRTRVRRAQAPGHEAFTALPWTDRWLRDWRNSEARGDDAAPDDVRCTDALRCRHGVADDAAAAGDRAPVPRALSVSHTIVRPGSQVSVTWCFDGAREVVVDGRRGHPACGEALVTIAASRRIAVQGGNRCGRTSLATPTVIAVAAPQVDLPTLAVPPPVALTADVGVSVGAAAPITRRLDDFWAAQEALQPRFASPPRMVGIPSSVVRALRSSRRDGTVV